MIALVLAAIAMQAAPDPCMAVPQGETARSCAEWRPAGRIGQFETFLDPASVTRQGAAFELSLRILYDASQGGVSRSAVSRHLFDCAARTSGMLHITAYDAAGAVIEDREARGFERMQTRIPSTSPFAALLAEFCPRPAP